ncbi:MAG: hypothetical protein KatS3mg054_0656 [Chloroflexus sp.]|nr:MAG: hypothetical protein KatS3mg054_0656 [Chloroflexus sp.]
MRPSWLKHRVTIQQLAVTQNTYGEQVETWTDLRSVWASIEPLRGQEYIASKTMQAAVDHRIRLRYAADITPHNHRIVYKSRIFEIESVIHVREARVETQLMCREQVA